MTVSLRLNRDDEELFKKYAEINNLTLSELFRNAVYEKIENEYDLKCYEEAISEYRKNPVTYTLEEVKREIGIWNIMLYLLIEQRSK